MIATIWEVWNDRHGDLNKAHDITIRALLLTVEALLVGLIFHKSVVISWALSVAIFFMFFDYLVAYVLIRNKVIEVPGAHWFTYTAKKGLFDNMKWWKFNPRANNATNGSSINLMPLLLLCYLLLYLQTVLRILSLSFPFKMTFCMTNYRKTIN